MPHHNHVTRDSHHHRVGLSRLHSIRRRTFSISDLLKTGTCQWRSKWGEAANRPGRQSGGGGKIGMIRGHRHIMTFWGGKIIRSPIRAPITHATPLTCALEQNHDHCAAAPDTFNHVHTVAQKCDCRRCLAVFCDSLTFLRQCAEGLTRINTNLPINSGVTRIWCERAGTNET